MSPTFNDKDIIVQEAYSWSDIEDLRVGDIFTFKSPLDPKLMTTKRITALARFSF